MLRKERQPEITYYCRDCKNARDFHGVNYYGKPFMCKCDYYTDGVYSRLINHDKACKHFTLRQTPLNF